MLKRGIVPFLAAAVVAMALLALTACGGGGEEKAKTPAPRATPAASPAARSPAASPAASPAVSGDLGQLLAKSKQAQFQASYDFKGPAEELGKGSLTLAIKQGKSAVTIKAEDIEITVIDDGQSIFLCGEVAKLVTGKGGKDCFKAPRTGGGPGGELVKTLTELNPEELVSGLAGQAKVEKEGGQTIASRKATCFKLSSQEGQGRICVDDSLGIPLLIEGNLDGQGNFKATKVSEQVSDDAFKPPYRVKDISELGGG